MDKNKMRIGTDTSFWAENVDYTKMVANGAEFTILRAGQGSWIDNYFQKNYDASEGMLPRSAYWFFDQRYKPSRQAELLAAALKDNPLEGYIWADYERDYDGASYAKWEDFHTFLREIERLIPEMVGRIGVYTRYYYFTEKVPSNSWYLFEDYPFWEARYKAESPFDKPFKCLLWQYSETGDGLAYGLDPYVKKFIDLNYFRGSDEEWKKFTGSVGEITPPVESPIETDPESPVEPPVASPIVGKVVIDDLRLRREPNVKVENVPIGEFWNWGVTIDIQDERYDSAGNLWYQVPVWAAGKYNGTTFIEIEEEDDDEIVVPPIEPPPDGERRTDWKSDPDRPSELYYSRHTGYHKVPVYSNVMGKIDFEAPQSAIFIGDKKLGKWLHIIRMNDPNTLYNGWIDTEASDMICHQVPEVTLNSLIPPKVVEPTIKRYSTIPDTGDFMYVSIVKSKDYQQPQPSTVVLWVDNANHAGWIDTTPELQWLMFDLLKVAAPAQSIVYYVMAYAYHYADNRYWTDLSDKDDHRDDVLGLNPNATCFKVKYSITTQGNAVEVVSRNGSNVVLGGIDITKTLPYAEDIIDSPHLVHWATQQDPEILSNGKPKTPHFPSIKQMVDGKIEKTGTPFPKIAAPYEVSMQDAALVDAPSGSQIEHVNLSRWL